MGNMLVPGIYVAQELSGKTSGNGPLRAPKALESIAVLLQEHLGSHG
jgi:hypothetical protein